MYCRTDLALERHEMLKRESVEGVNIEKYEKDKIKVSKIEVLNDIGEENIEKPKGKYITVELQEFSHHTELLDERHKILTELLLELLPADFSSALVVGLGNENITPDALGPQCVNQIFATRHIKEDLCKDLGVDKLKGISAISTGVLGQTGIETAEYIKGIVDLIFPEAVIVIDALASRSLSRLGKTVQMSDTGISPGAGVGNFRLKIDKSTLGVPVIAIGVPTVVDGETIVYELLGENSDNNILNEESKITMVTPKDIDVIINRAARQIALAVNCALHPNLSAETILSLT